MFSVKIQRLMGFDVHKCLSYFFVLFEIYCIGNVILWIRRFWKAYQSFACKRIHQLIFYMPYCMYTISMVVSPRKIGKEIAWGMRYAMICMTSIESSECLVANRVCVEVPCILMIMQIWKYITGNNWKYVRNMEYVNMKTNISNSRPIWWVFISISY